MLADINMLLDRPVLLFVVLLVGGLIGIAVERTITGVERERRKAWWAGRNAAKGKWPRNEKAVPFRKEKTTVPLKGTPERATHDAAEQLRCVMEADFTPRNVLNQPERRLLACIDKALAEVSPGWRAMAQVSLGEILASADKDAYFAINSKRVDLLIMDADCRPLHAIEFQGTGHHLGQTAAARDAVKKEALRRAGIGYAEVVSGDTPAEVREMVRKLVTRNAPETSPPALLR